MLSAALNLLVASIGPTNFPSASCNSMPNFFKLLIVSTRCVRVKIVLKPVAILSADSRVVLLTDVNSAKSSSKLPPALSNAEPVVLTAVIKSDDSTANSLET